MRKYFSAVISLIILVMHIPVASAYSFLGANLVSQQLPDLVISEINFYDETSHINVEVVVLNKGGYLEAKNLLADVEINNDIYQVIDVINSRKETGTLTLDTYEKTTFYFEVRENELDHGENIFEIEIDSDNHVKESYEQNNFEDISFQYNVGNNTLPDLFTKITDISINEQFSGPNNIRIDYEIHNIGTENAKSNTGEIDILIRLNGNDIHVMDHQNRSGNLFLPEDEMTFSTYNLQPQKVQNGLNTVEVCSDQKSGYNGEMETGRIKEIFENNNCAKKDFEYDKEEVSNNQIELNAEYMPHNGFYGATVTFNGSDYLEIITDAEVWLDSMYNQDTIRCMAMTPNCGWHPMEYSHEAGMYFTQEKLYTNKNDVKITASYEGQSTSYIIEGIGIYLKPGYPENPCDGEEGIKGYYDDSGTWREYEGEIITTDQCVYNPFVDVDPNDITGKAAIELQARNIINGFEDGTYRGQDPVNRAQVTKFLLNGAGYDADGYTNNGKFSDVLENQWYTKYVSKAADLGIVKGYGNGNFGPDNQVLRAELIVMITRAFDLEEYMKSSYKYDDVDSNTWVHEYAGIADIANMFPENSSSLNPYEPLTRNEVGVAIYQTLMAIENGSL